MTVISKTEDKEMENTVPLGDWLEYKKYQKEVCMKQIFLSDIRASSIQNFIKFQRGLFVILGFFPYTPKIDFKGLISNKVL